MKGEIKGLYVVTERNNARGHEEIAGAALKAGANIIQLRDKTASTRKLLKIAKKINEICKEHGRVFIVNDRPDIALFSGADGVHLGSKDLPVYEVKKYFPSLMVGVSVSSAEEAKRVVSEGADYVAVSPVYETSTKKDAARGLGIEMIREISSAVDISVVAIGGINAENVENVIEAGADAAAVVSYVSRAENPEKAALELNKLIKRTLKRRAL